MGINPSYRIDFNKHESGFVKQNTTIAAYSPVFSVAQYRGWEPIKKVTVEMIIIVINPTDHKKAYSHQNDPK